MEFFMIALNICLSDIPEGKRHQGKDGKWYADVIVAPLKETDRFGNSIMSFCSQSKEEKDAKVTRTYIGKGKFVKGGIAANETANTPTSPETDDLPY